MPPEVWLRGPVNGYDPLLMPVVHALLQAREDIHLVGTMVSDEAARLRPGGAASVAFHLRHLAGALDRLLTYARGEMLSDEQQAALVHENDESVSASLHDVILRASGQIDRALSQIRTTDVNSLLDARRVGRAQLPATVLGLLFHAAEHTTRHAGQAITTAKIVANR